jgi:4a-hydroxytetrahydrobiopterin dehydratase
MPSQDLTSKSCTPCRGGIPPLTSDEVESYHRDTPEWTIHDENRRIERTFKFANFAEAFAFVKRVAELAEAEGHHPQMSFGWGYATVSLQTKKIGGLHENDFIMAAKLDQLASLGEPTFASASSPMVSPTAHVTNNRQLTP